MGSIDFVLADIPGLIEGAHEGHGLGDRFLGHVERTSVLLHLIDCTQDDIVGAYHTIRKELEEYDPKLAEKPEIIALSKADALGEELAEDQRQTLEKALGKSVQCISSVAHYNFEDILFQLAHAIKDYKEEQDQTEHIDERLEELETIANTPEEANEEQQ